MLETAGHSQRYRPDIDGLRAIAVLSVVFYHIGLTEFPGGFVGVDVFFVISGYLITSSIVADARGAGFSFLAFYDRRMRRIFPALFVMAVIVTFVVAVFLPPGDLADYAKSLAAMSGFVSNIYFRIVGSDGGYFAKAANDQFLLHTWSLSVEEQFYLVMPVLVVLVRRRSDAFKLGIFAVLAVLSFGFSVVAVKLSPLEAFYSAASRAWELLLGSLLAVGLFPRDPSRRTREVLSLLGLGLIGFAIFFFETSTPFPGANALFPCCGALLIIATGGRGETSVERALSTKPMTAVGRMSYSLYLWHWPIVATARYLTVGHLNLPIRIGIVLSSLGAAYASLVLVERPFRRRPFPLPRRTVVASGLAASAALACIGAAVVATGGLPQRFSPEARALIAANERRETEHPAPACENYRKDVRSMADILFCPIGDEPQHIMFWGDSHVHQLEPLVRSLYDGGQLGGRSALFAISAACPVALNLDRAADGFHCAAFTRLALQRALQKDVETVFFGFAAWFDLNDIGACEIVRGTCGKPLPHQRADDLFLASLRDIVMQLKSHGKTVVIGLPSPFYSDSIPELLIKKIALGRLDRWLDVDSRLTRHDFVTLRERIIALARELNVRTFDPREALCPDNHCIYERNEVSLYTDNNHVAGSQVGMFRPALIGALDGGRGGDGGPGEAASLDRMGGMAPGEPRPRSP